TEKDLRDDIARDAYRQPFGRPGHELSEVHPADEALDEPEHTAFVLAEVDDGDDVGMVELSRQLRLLEEHRAIAVVIVDVRQDDLQRALAVEAELGGAPDLAHPPLPDALLEPETARKGIASFEDDHRGPPIIETPTPMPPRGQRL